MGIATVALAAVVVAAVAGCASQPAPAPVGSPSAESMSVAQASRPAAAPLPAVSGYRYDDPADVCRRFTAALFSADTTVDAVPGDARRRAAGYAGPALTADLDRSTVDGRWPTWRQHWARLDIRISEHVDDEPAVDSTVSAYRAVLATVTPVGADGWRGWTETTIVYCTLTRFGGQWRVTEFSPVPLAGSP